MRKQMEVVTVQLSKLKADPKNARGHNRRNIEAIKESLEAFGQHRPFVVQKSTGKIIVGNGMFAAMKELGWTEGAAYYVDDDEAESVKRALADNRTGELAEWNMDALADIFSEFDGEALIGWTDEERAALLDDQDGASAADVKEDDFDVSDALDNPSFVQRGDIWKIGKHRLVCGDSTKKEDVDVLMNKEKAALVFTDPPWNVNYGAVKDDNAQGYKPRQILNDYMPTDEFKKFMRAAFARMKESIIPGAIVYVVMSAQEWGNLMLTLAENDFHWSSTIIWNKDRLVLSRKDYHTKYEPIWYGWDGRAPRLHPLKDRKQSDVWDVPRPHKSEEHPTMKPLELIAIAIENSSSPGDMVLDLFGGSGSTLICAEQMGRICYMMELDEKYASVIVRRAIENGISPSEIQCVRCGTKYRCEDLLAHAG